MSVQHLAAPASRTVQVIAHRARADAASAENSLGGAVRALQLGCEAVEVDVRSTVDGALVLMHDHTPRRTTSATDPRRAVRFRHVEQSTSRDIRGLRLRDSSGRDTGEDVPLMTDLIDTVREHNAWTLLDVKAQRRGEPTVWRLLAAQFRRLSPRVVSTIVVQGTDFEALRGLARDVPSVKVVGISWHRERPRNMRQLDGISRADWTLRQGTMYRDRRERLMLFTWVVNDRASMDRALSLGVDGIITDRPAEMLVQRGTSVALATQERSERLRPCRCGA